ncbi:galactose-3-O-sulfotransferase 2-like [Ruditapes philippinarum]|uniref:galactose-3-O-sulfotransferase 2-like n=1 Tax=Ruditapes philippinarum TaxID=129788 RepID=UPI00295B90EA|nr:galactose-3-O-sulfotransferase 2-like [Ruditapes philippinarum]
MPDKLEKMFGRFRKVTGCIFLVAMVICVIAILGPTETEYATVVHLNKGLFQKHPKQSLTERSFQTEDNMQLTDNMKIEIAHRNLEFSQYKENQTFYKSSLEQQQQQYYHHQQQQKQQKEQQQLEVRHIGFLKVHKAASSTMQNIFFRFGLKRNLTFVFTSHPNYFSRIPERHLPLVKPRHRKSYDIICTHGVFNYNVYSSLLPTDTVYIATVRDPLAVFISAVNYYTQPTQQIQYIAKIRGNRLQKLIQNPELYDRQFFSYTKNVMARDFGFPKTNDEGRVNAKLKELGQTFKLVLLVEYIEESLILMKRYLKWNLKDILFVSNNVYGKGQTMEDLTTNDVAKFKTRNKLDYKVYDYFYERFWDQFNKESDEIKFEVSHFKNVLTDLNKYCNYPTQKGRNDNLLQVEQSKWNEQFSISFEECYYMKKDELEFITQLRQKQGSELRG